MFLINHYHMNWTFRTTSHSQIISQDQGHITFTNHFTRSGAHHIHKKFHKIRSTNSSKNFNSSTAKFHFNTTLRLCKYLLTLDISLPATTIIKYQITDYLWNCIFYAHASNAPKNPWKGTFHKSGHNYCVSQAQCISYAKIAKLWKGVQPQKDEDVKSKVAAKKLLW